MALDVKFQLQLKQTQQLVMTPQLQQAIRLLQMNRMDLAETIQAELQENPVLEEATAVAVDSLRVSTNSNGGIEEGGAYAAEQEPAAGPTRKEDSIDWEAYIENYAYTAPLPSNRNLVRDDLPGYEQTLCCADSLTDHLVWQIRMSDMEDVDREIAAEIVNNLDDSGYLRDAGVLPAVAAEHGVAMARVEQVLKQVQRLDPVGIAARNLQECLLAQADHYHVQDNLVIRILQEQMHNLEKRNYAGIMKELRAEREEVRQALKIIEGFDPKPGRAYGDTTSQYITPDIYVYKVGDDYVISLNEDGLPKLNINSYYREALRNGGLKNQGEAKAYIQEKLRSAAWLIKSIHQRQRTIYRVMESILKYQRDFFDKGAEHLKPLVLRDVAQDLKMHESTISRVTSNKFVHTPRGIFELKYFFNSSIQQGGGENIASEPVKIMIKKLFDNEPADKPLSDQQIVEALGKENIAIARRTVAKYRDLMGILPSSKRRKSI